ncbi:response regulator [Roseisalinus antarcticus]|uniref:Response regulatory domain-containing protein n=1 Tax=Roseisalinus antarcticus TaxID=254357 RepID=A0A1Y5U0J3_9RHOB|nr:response regulator [Roseisalinus antarcticus]SLN78006.1 hypothetical protein ROA7023_04652 [Roseisalinus antarcticus]
MTESEALEFAIEAARSAQAAAERAASRSPNWLEVLDRLPSLLLVLFFIGLILWNYRRLDAILERTSGVKAFGFEMVLGLNRDLERAAASFDDVRVTKTFKGGEEAVSVTADDRTRVLKRANACSTIISGRHVLWLDDRPDNNKDEVDLLQKLDLQVTCISTDQAALDLIQNGAHHFQLMISDMERGGDHGAGTSFLSKLRDNKIKIPVVFYLSDLDNGKPLPVSSFGITNRPDELLHLVIDALERVRPLS